MLADWERKYLRRVLRGAEKTRLPINVVADSCYYVWPDKIKYLRAKKSGDYFCEDPTETLGREDHDGLGRIHVWEF